MVVFFYSRAKPKRSKRDNSELIAWRYLQISLGHSPHARSCQEGISEPRTPAHKERPKRPWEPPPQRETCSSPPRRRLINAAYLSKMMAFPSPQLPASTMASSFAANATTEISAAAAIAATATATRDLLFNASLAPNEYGNFSGETSFLFFLFFFSCSLDFLLLLSLFSFSLEISFLFFLFFFLVPWRLPSYSFSSFFPFSILSLVQFVHPLVFIHSSRPRSRLLRSGERTLIRGSRVLEFVWV